MIKTLVLGSIAATGVYGMSRLLKKKCYPVHFQNKETFENSIPCTELYLSATLSHLAYAEPYDVLQRVSSDKKYSCVLGLEKPCYIDGHPKEDAQAYIWHSKNERRLYVAFRGTEDIRDTLVNLDVRQHVITNDILVHNGFYRQFKSVVRLLEAHITTVADEVNEIVFCGHSLGGALATIASAYFGHRGFKVKCHTFGSPRVGNANFKESFTQVVKENWRVFNENDPVPMIPISHRFVHVSGGMCINDNDQIALILNDVPWYLRLFISYTNVDFKNIVCDHDCTLYMKRLLYDKQV